ncbi:MAG: Rossmann-like domain, partial [Thermoleophilaceae bacterium]|nr:Rossmann-like domain [Thermoleophilaceae bacterium]
MPATAGPLRIAIVGDGRVGGAIARALLTAGNEVVGPVGRRELGAGDSAVAGSSLIDAV